MMRRPSDSTLRYISTLKIHKLFSVQRAKQPDPESEILDTVVPPEEKPRARELLKLIKPYLSWNEDGEIVANSRVVPFSNISDLLSNLMSSSTKKPEGWDEVADILSAARVPRHLIRNKRRLADISRKRPPSSSSGKKKNKKARRRIIWEAGD